MKTALRLLVNAARGDVQWQGIGLKGENEKVFMICSTGGTIFMFGKKYLTDEQQQELRRLSGLASVNTSIRS